MPDSIETIGDYAFYNCDKITGVTLPKSLKTIGWAAFYDCGGLNTVCVPRTVTSIYSDAFLSCDELTIYGVPNSYAQTYAVDNNIPFVVLDEKEVFNAYEFTIGRDNNSFNHTPNSFFSSEVKNYRIKSKIYRDMLYRDQDENYRDLLIQKQFQEWKGSCYGISESILYAYYGDYDLTEYLGEEDEVYPYYCSLNKPVNNPNLKDLIQAFQLSQYRSDATYTDTTINSFVYKTFGIGSDVKSLLRELVEEAELSHYKKPFLICVTYEKSGHALLVCGSEGEIGGYYKLTICDPNSFEPRYLMIKTDYSEFHMEDKNGNIIYEDKIDSNSFRELKYVTYEDAYSNSVSNQDQIDACEIIVSAESSFYMTTDTGQYLLYDGEEFDGNLDIDNVTSTLNSSEDEGANWIIKISGVNKVTFSDMSPDMEVDCLFDSDEYINVTGKNMNGLSFEDDKGVSIEGENAIYTLSIAAKDPEHSLVQISGTTSEIVSYHYNADKIDAEGVDNLTEIEVNKITEDGIQEIDVNQEEIIYTEQKPDHVQQPDRTQNTDDKKTTDRKNTDYSQNISDIMNTGNNKISSNTPQSDQKTKTGWIKVGNTWHYMNGDGTMQTGWVNDGTGWYYMSQSGAMQTGWVNDGGTWYYMSQSGAMQTGWVNDGGTWYYTSGSGAMQTGWINEGGTWYYMNASGAMQTGWINVGGAWYYISGSGAMQTGWVNDGGKWYYMDASGVMQTGWLSDSGSWYYLGTDGAMRTGWYSVGGKYYYSYESGKLAVNTKIGSYRVNAKGEWVK